MLSDFVSSGVTRRTATLYVLLPSDIPYEEELAERANHGAKGTGMLRGRADEYFPEGNFATVAPQQSDDAAHDAYFHIGRLQGDAVSVFINMALAARDIFHRERAEGPAGPGGSRMQQIDAALADLIAAVVGNSGSNGGQIKAEGHSRDVTRRWIRGHQIFAALTQGLIFSLRAMAHALRAGRVDGTRRWVDLSISLLDGSAATFEFTGDFTAEEYNGVVRPSMMPPVSPICLSGLMSNDHRFLVRLAGKIKPSLKALQDLDPLRHHRLHEAMTLVYENHIHVCERFVGTRPSILTDGRTEKSGPELLDHFRALRLRPFEPKIRVARAAAGQSACPQDNFFHETENNI